MIVHWDENKHSINIAKHRIDFIDAQRIFDYDTVTIEDNRFNYGEQRFITHTNLEKIMIIWINGPFGIGKTHTSYLEM
ncbi:MAG: BrnT family toxin [Cyanobacterium sp. T60_A2020_053]|nr:BrnT family toxin [Cyanobacterium sp. T60_A2020_053]